jgi:hypothetical protein
MYGNVISAWENKIKKKNNRQGQIVVSLIGG